MDHFTSSSNLEQSWHSFAQSLALFIPTYATISSLILPHPKYHKRLLVLCALLHLHLSNEAWRLSRPIYVCIDPIGGKTFHHPSESQLRIQFQFQLLTAVFVVIALGCKILPVWRRAKEREEIRRSFLRRGEWGIRDKELEEKVRCIEKEKETMRAGDWNTVCREWWLSVAGEGILALGCCAGWYGWWIMLGR